MKSYKVTGPRPVMDAEPGEELVAAFSAEEEADLLNAGRLALLPREYEVVGPSVVHGAKPGQKFKAELRIHEEIALVESGAVEIVVQKGAKAPANTTRRNANG